MSGVWGFYIFEIFEYSREKLLHIFIDFFAIKFDGYDVNQESVYMKTSAQIPGLTSLPLTLTAKKSSKIKFSAAKIYYNFSHEHPKISNM